MRKYTDKALREYLADRQFLTFKERDLMPELVAYLDADNDNKVLALCGLRRTGKTTMLQQAISGHVGYDDAIYIRCQKSDKTDDIADVIMASGKKYVFLDEVTKVPDFIDLASVYSDEAAFSGHKIIMAGTDSLEFSFAKNGELFDRIHIIHTTHISFAEYNHLTGKNLFQYMKYGGTLSDEDYFYNEDSLAEYTNAAIADNILHTYKYWDMGKHKDDLLPVVSEEQMYSLINTFIRDENKRFVASVIQKGFEAKEFHSAAQMYERAIKKSIRHPEQIEKQLIPSPDVLRDISLASEWQEKLRIENSYPFEVNDYLLSMIRENLIRLDVLTCVSQYGEYRYYFTQPGMRYCHINAAIETLCENERVKADYSASEIRFVSQKIRDDVEGQLIEDITFLDLLNRFKNDPHISVSKFRINNIEYDIAVINTQTKRALAFEVKHSSQMFEAQKKHLLNTELKEAFERINNVDLVGSAVLYSGTTGKDGDGFCYINTTDFLTDIDGNINNLCPDFISKDAGEMEYEHSPKR